MERRPPPVSTVMDFSETMIPKAAKAGEIKSARVMSAAGSDVIHWKGP